jgi:hypothetical protein
MGEGQVYRQTPIARKTPKIIPTLSTSSALWWCGVFFIDSVLAICYTDKGKKLMKLSKTWFRTSFSNNYIENSLA